MVFACKKCKKCFRKDMTQFEEPDEYCPHCDNHYVIEAVTPETIQEEKTARAKALRLKREQAKQAVTAAIRSTMPTRRKTRASKDSSDEDESKAASEDFKTPEEPDVTMKITTK